MTYIPYGETDKKAQAGDTVTLADGTQETVVRKGLHLTINEDRDELTDEEIVFLGKIGVRAPKAEYDNDGDDEDDGSDVIGAVLGGIAAAALGSDDSDTSFGGSDDSGFGGFGGGSFDGGGASGDF